jgi:hypothetical protein
MPTQYFARILLLSGFLIVSPAVCCAQTRVERPRPHDGGVQERLVSILIPAVPGAPLQRHSVHRIRSHAGGWQQNYARTQGHRA